MRVFAASLLEPLNLIANICVERFKHGSSELKTSGSFEVLKHKNLLLMGHFAGSSASWKNIGNLDIVYLRLKKVQ